MLVSAAGQRARPRPRPKEVKENKKVARMAAKGTTTANAKEKTSHSVLSAGCAAKSVVVKINAECVSRTLTKIT